MIVIIAVSLVVGLVLVAAIVFVAGHVDVESSSSAPFAGMFMFQRPLDRPRGVQEEDLPPFVFHSEAAAVRR